MRSLLFLALTATGLIFFLQNRQPITLFFLGTSQQSALASLTLPLGLWVVIFTSAGIFTSLIINGLSSIGQPSQRRSPKEPRRSGPNPSVNPAPQRPEPEPRSPSPRYSPPEPEPIVDDGEWDWDEPIPEIADWNGKIPAPSPKPEIRDRPRPERPTPTPRSESPEPISQRAAPRPEFIAPEPAPPEPKIEPVPESEPQRREPLPDLRQFEAPQTPTATKRQGTIYSQQYRPGRSPVTKAPKTAEDTSAKPQTIYDAPYRVINPSSNPASVNPDNLGNGEEDEDWI